MNAPVAICADHPHTVDDIARMAKVVAASGLFGVKTIEQAAALMFLAQADGLHPATVARDYDIIEGRPAKRAEAMLRDFIRNGGSVTWHLLSDKTADATFTHPQGGEVRISWDMERAWAADLGASDMWRRFPRQMLRSRVLSEGIRTVCPMATGGMYVPEEVRDFGRSNAGKARSGSTLVESGAATAVRRASLTRKEAEAAETASGVVLRGEKAATACLCAYADEEPAPAINSEAAWKSWRDALSGRIHHAKTAETITRLAAANRASLQRRAELLPDTEGKIGRLTRRTLARLERRHERAAS
jgi:hypothetical protein